MKAVYVLSDTPFNIARLSVLKTECREKYDDRQPCKGVRLFGLSGVSEANLRKWHMPVGLLTDVAALQNA